MAYSALKLVLIVALAYGLILIAACFVQRKLMYFPSPERVSPSAVGLENVEERIIETPDGERVIAWYGRAAPGQPTILYFHGNGGNLALRADRVRRHLEHGRGMLMMSYRGYSGSTGQPTETANVADGQLAYELLVGEGIAPSDIIVYGESLGSGIATRMASEKPVGGLILDAPFTSAVDVGAWHYPFLPVRMLMLWDRYEVERIIGDVRAPVLVVHGERDQIVPYEMGRAVFEAANEPKKLVTLRLAGHNDHSLHGSFDAIQDWIDQIRSGSN